MMDRRTFILGSIGAAALGAGCSDGSEPSATPRGTAPDRGQSSAAARNVVVVYADDMRLDELPFMPFVSSLADRGTEFTLARQMTPMCSPARAGFLRGQYATGPQGHDIVAQASNYSPLEEEMLPVWLQDAGVECGLVGKYFVGLARSAAPGWSYWRSPFGPTNSDNLGYVIGTEDGSTEEPEAEQAHYFGDKCEEFVRQAQSPWFLWYCPNDPHFPLEGTSDHADEFTDFDWPVPPIDVDGKPSYIRALPEPSNADVSQMQAQQRGRLRELLDLDDTVAHIWATLESTGQLDETAIVFTSDNGNALLNHRLPALGKNAPYDACMRVPMVATGPGFGEGSRVESPVSAAQDLTATVLQVFDVAAPIPQAGVSLFDVAADPSSHRDRRLLGHCDPANGPEGMPPCDIITTVDRKLTRYRGETGADEYELYEIDVDPEELRNVANDGSHREELDALAAALDELLSE